SRATSTLTSCPTRRSSDLAWNGNVRVVAVDLAGNTTTREMNLSTAIAAANNPTGPSDLAPIAPPMLPSAEVHFPRGGIARQVHRSEEHTSELQSRGHLVCR